MEGERLMTKVSNNAQTSSINPKTSNNNPNRKFHAAGLMILFSKGACGFQSRGHPLLAKVRIISVIFFCVVFFFFFLFFPHSKLPG